MTRAQLLSLAVALAACGVEAPAPARPVTHDPIEQTAQQEPLTGFPCDVHAVLQAACAGCHARPAYFETFTTRAELVTLAPSATERLTTSERPMPPYGAARQLSADERALLVGWLEGGAPAGTCGSLAP